jgi:ankyrin repeat protein
MSVVPEHFARIYAENNDFKEAFDAMHDAVENLPEGLVAEGRDLPYPQLHHACLTGNGMLVGALLANGLNANMYPCTEDEDDLTPLGWLAREEEMELAEKIAMAEILLAKGADPEEGDPAEQAELFGDSQFEEFLNDAVANYVH